MGLQLPTVSRPRGTHYQGRGMRQQVWTHLLEMVRTSWYGEQEK